MAPPSSPARLSSNITFLNSTLLALMYAAPPSPLAKQFVKCESTIVEERDESPVK